MVVFLVHMQRMGCEVSHIDDRSAEMSARTDEFLAQIDFEAALNGTQKQVDPDCCGAKEHDLGNGHGLT
jgi:hypothetical protein